MSNQQSSGTSIAEAVREAASVAVGMASVAAQAVDAALHDHHRPTASTAAGAIPQQRVSGSASLLVDTVVGSAVITAQLTARTATAAARVVRAATRPLTDRLIPRGLSNTAQVRALTDLGHRERLFAEKEARVLTRRIAHELAILVLNQLDLTHEVLDRVDLDVIAKSIDLDAAVSRVDLDAIIDRIDLDRAVRRVDLDAIIDQVDLNRAVGHVDLDAIIDQVDLNRAVRRVDLDAVVDQVNLDRAVLRVDLDAVIDRIDLVGLAAEIVAALDLPDIIRGSSGSLATDMVRDARVQSMAADEAVNRIVDRMLLRRRRARIGSPSQSPDEPRVE